MNERNEQLGNMPINNLLLKLSLPATVGMMVNALYNFVDAIFIGLGVSADGLGGLTIAFPIQMLIMALAQMVGIGAASAVSRNLGSKNYETAYRTVGNAYILILMMSTIMVSFGLIFIEPVLNLFGAASAPELLPYAKDYMSVIFMGSIFFSFAVASNNLIRSEGNAKVAMVTMIIGTGLNILLDPIFIFVLDMGIRGAAIATILSQFASFIFIIRYLRSGQSSLKIKPHHLKPDRKIIQEIITVGLPAFTRQVGGSVLAIVLNNSLGFYGGKIAINAYGAINRIIMFLFMPMFGVIQGMQPIAGFNFGAQKYNRVIEVVHKSIAAVTVFCIFGFTLSQLLSTQLMSLFVKETAVIEVGSQAIKYIFLAIPIVGIQIVSSSFYQAIGRAKPSLILSMMRQILFLIPLIYVLPKMGLGLMGIWIAFPISDIISTAISAWMLRHEVNRLKTKEPKEICTA